MPDAASSSAKTKCAIKTALILAVGYMLSMAQRIPLRIKLDDLPEGVKLRFGLTASAMITGQ